MRNIFTIAGREIRSYFVSPIAYVVLTGFLLLGGWFFFNLLARFNMLLTIYSAQQNPQVLERLNLNEFVIAPLLHNLSVILVILVPGDHHAQPRRGEEGRHLRAAAHLAAPHLRDRARQVPRRLPLRRDHGRRRPASTR